jgi:hypothetical protein
MAAYKFTHNVDDFIIETDQLPNGKWIARIDPPGGGGDWIRQPAQQTTDPATGKTTKKIGNVVEFDSENEAITAAEDNIKMGIY